MACHANMPSLTSEEMDELSCKITEYAMVFLFQEWVKEAVPTMLGDKIAFLVCHFPTSPHHELQPMGLRFIEAFYMQYVHRRYMNPAPAVVEAMRIHILDLFKARMESPMDNTIPPTTMDYLEGVLDPVLFPHNLKVLFQEGNELQKFLKIQMQSLIEGAHRRRKKYLDPHMGCILRELSVKQLHQVAQIHQLFMLECKDLNERGISKLLNAQAEAETLTARVHAKLCIHELGKQIRAGIVKQEPFVYRVSVRLHKEYVLRKSIMPNLESLMKKYNVTFDTEQWCM